MLEFFKPWRRKVGVLTLVMACLSLAWWVRSLYYQDNFTIPVDKHTEHWVVSGLGIIGWARYCDMHTETTATEWRQSWISGSDATAFDAADELSAFYKWHRYGFGIAIPFFSPNIEVTGAVLIFPYWSVVLPLGFFSLLLLFKQPPPTIQEKMSDTGSTGDTAPNSR